MVPLYPIALVVMGIGLMGTMLVYWPRFIIPYTGNLTPVKQLNFLSGTSKSSVELLSKMFPALQTGVLGPDDFNSFFDNWALPIIPTNSGYPDDLFSYENVREDEPVDTVFNETFAEYINGYGGDCARHEGVLSFNSLLQKWHQLATLERIPYFIMYGTLLGYTRNKDFIPYDGDLDIYVPGWAQHRLRKYATADPAAVSSYGKSFILYLHRELGVIGTSMRRRFECNGTLIHRYTGLCSFLTNFGRLHYKHRFVDIWEMNYYPTIGKGVIGSTTSVQYYDPSVLFPRRHCTVGGVRTFCPNDPIKLVKMVYGKEGLQKMNPSRICENGKYIYEGEEPVNVTNEMFKKYSAEWNNKYAEKAANEETGLALLGQNLTSFGPLEQFCKMFDPTTSKDFPEDCARIEEETVRSFNYSPRTNRN